jgi:hypothetical protein
MLIELRTAAEGVRAKLMVDDYSTVVSSATA